MNVQTISYTANPENTSKFTVSGLCMAGRWHPLPWADLRGGSRVQKELVTPLSARKCNTRQGWAILEEERGFPIYSWFLFEKPICLALLCILKAIYWSRLCHCSSISNKVCANWSPREALQQNRLQKISQGLREQEKRESSETKSLFSLLRNDGANCLLLVRKRGDGSFFTHQ